MTLTNSYSQSISYLDNDEKDDVGITDAIRMMKSMSLIVTPLNHRKRYKQGLLHRGANQILKH